MSPAGPWGCSEPAPTVCGGWMPTGRPGINQQQRTGAVFAGAGRGPSMCACPCESARTCGPGRCPQLRSQWTSGSGVREVGIGGAEGLVQWWRLWEAGSRSKKGWGRMPADGWRKAWRPRVQHCFLRRAPVFPRQILGLASPLRPPQAPPPHAQTCWVACAPSHPRREEEISLEIHIKIDVFLDKQRA